VRRQSGTITAWSTQLEAAGVINGKRPGVKLGVIEAGQVDMLSEARVPLKLQSP
jgi:hypothetical protein